MKVAEESNVVKPIPGHVPDFPGRGQAAKRVPRIEQSDIFTTLQELPGHAQTQHSATNNGPARLAITLVLLGAVHNDRLAFVFAHKSVNEAVDFFAI